MISLTAIQRLEERPVLRCRVGIDHELAIREPGEDAVGRSGARSSDMAARGKALRHRADRGAGGGLGLPCAARPKTTGRRAEAGECLAQGVRLADRRVDRARIDLDGC